MAEVRRGEEQGTGVEMSEETCIGQMCMTKVVTSNRFILKFISLTIAS